MSAVSGSGKREGLGKMGGGEVGEKGAKSSENRHLVCECACGKCCRRRGSDSSLSASSWSTLPLSTSVSDSGNVLTHYVLIGLVSP